MGWVTHPVDIGGGLDIVQELEVEVSGNTEDGLDFLLFETARARG